MLQEISLDNALQSVSRTQASGALHILADDSELLVHVVNGKIVHVSREGEDPHIAICGMLQRAGCLAESVVELLSESEVSVEQLRQVLVAKNYLSEWEFDQAKTAYELDLLYSLHDADEVAVEFHAKPLSLGPADVLRVLPVHFLLDLVELEVEEQRFLDAFATEEETEVFLLLEDVDEQVLSSDERIICGIIAEGCTPADVFELSLLNRHSVVSSLLSLLEKEFVRAVTPEELEDGEEFGDEEEFDEELQAEEGEVLEESDALFEGLFDDDLESESMGDVAAGDGVFDGQGVWGAFDGADGDIDPGQPVDFDAVEEEGEALEEEMPFPAELEAESNRWAEKENEQSNFSGPGAMIRSLNYRLTEPSTIQNVVIVVTSVYLLLLALIVPDMVESWFSALSNFTNVSR